jgi:hypothetical protein
VGIREQVKALSQKVSDSDDLMKALSQDPVKALTIPLLRKDVEFLQGSIDRLSASVASDLANIRTSVTNETNRIYDLGKWFLGLILAASLIPLIEPLFRRRKKDEKPPSQEMSPTSAEDKGPSA